MFKSALLALKPSSTQDYVIDFAVELARRQNLQLAGCTVIDEAVIAPAEAVPLGGSAFKKERDEARLAAVRGGAETAAQKLQALCSNTRLSCRAVVCEGNTVETLAREVQQHDLMLLGHSAGDDTGDESLLHQIVKHSPRPVLVFPKQPAQGQSALVAYDGSLQAARTLASFAYSGLAAGREVHVLSAHSDGTKAGEFSRTACAFLAHHGIAAQGHAEKLAGPAAKTLLELVARHAPGLLAMGAFGKNAAHEFFFGSVTRSILHGLPCPVFLDH
jgi:nucleotide-binding universal stress UspA family protein